MANIDCLPPLLTPSPEDLIHGEERTNETLSREAEWCDKTKSAATLDWTLPVKQTEISILVTADHASAAAAAATPVPPAIVAEDLPETLSEDPISAGIPVVALEQPQTRVRGLWLNLRNRVAPQPNPATTEYYVNGFMQARHRRVSFEALEGWMRQRFLKIARPSIQVQQETGIVSEKPAADDDGAGGVSPSPPPPLSPATSDAKGKVTFEVSGGWKRNVCIELALSLNFNEFMELIVCEQFGNKGPHCIHAAFNGGRCYTNDIGYTPQDSIVFSGERASKIVLNDLNLMVGQRFDLECEKGHEEGVPTKSFSIRVRVKDINTGLRKTGSIARIVFRSPTFRE
mmetsp:Transcript_62061/g.106605  ORF Transcript_62061/g.106605 Transcript_62061/m.106605 type:complete len:343 (-) Transcript_62061:99-1127(-)